MSHHELPLSGDRMALATSSVLPANVEESRNGDWAGPAALTQPATSKGPDIMVFVHALRRHWLVALSVGVLCAAIAGPAAYFAVGNRYTASAFLRLAISDPQIAYRTEGQGMDRERFEIFKSTQQQLVKSRLVLIAALRKTEVARLDSVQRATKRGDEAGWLDQQLSVGFPGRAELMQVSVTRPDATEAETLVSAVVESYLSNVVNAELEQKRRRLSQIELVLGDREADLYSKREELKKLADTFGTSETEQLTFVQRMAIEELGSLRQEAARLDIQLRQYQSEYAGKKALLASIDSTQVQDAEVDQLVQSDPVARPLFVELGLRRMDQAYIESTVNPNARSPYTSRYQSDLSNIKQQFEARRVELCEVVKQRKRSIVEADVKTLESAIEVVKQQRREVSDRVTEQREQVVKYGKSSVQVEMLRASIKNLDTVVSSLGSECEKLRVEVRSPSRVALNQPASLPEVPSNTLFRMALSVFTGLLALCLPAGAIAMLDARNRRINNSEDVSKGLHLPVIGSVPLIPARVIRQLGSPSPRNQTWHIRLTESVDGIAARVLHKAETRQCRVIMISSAVGGEGKTTLSTQLALSLARAGRRTVLVDFDLRRPSFDEMFGLPLEPGVSEALRRQESVGEMVHETAAENLAVLTAGRWDRGALSSLSNGAAAAIFKELRADYDFIVVDTSPVLPVADARFVSQYVDSVVLSVFRDVSEAPKITAACEILAAFGVQNIEAVMTGSNDHMYGDHRGYQVAAAAPSSSEPNE